MNAELTNYILPILVVGFFVWRFLKFKKVKAELPELLKQGAVIVDVRSRSEFQMGARADSLNIPLDELDKRSNELDKNKTIILCCASGTRSGMAVGILKKNGFKDVRNAGSWTGILN